MKNWLAVLGCCGFIAWAEPVPRTFFCSFDGTVAPAEATGSGMAMPEKETYAPGRTGQGLAVREPNHAVYYLAAHNLPKDRGAVSLWIQPLWEPGDQGRQGFLCDDLPNAKAGVNTIWLWKIGNSLRFDVRDPKDSYITTSLADWRQGEWYHVVANWDCEKGTELYVNGTLAGARECTWIPRSEFRFAVGKRQRTTEAAGAVLNDLAIYARPLTAAEVELARAGTLPTVPAPRPAPQIAADSEPELLFHAPFDGTLAASRAGGGAEPQTAAGISFAPGALGEAAVFTRESRLVFPQPGNLNQAAGTISLWYKPAWELGVPGPDVWRCLFQQGPYPENRVGSNMIWFWLWGERLRFDVSDTRDSYARHVIGQWDSRRWHHLAVTWDHRRGTRMYLDGEPTGVSSDSGSGVLPKTWTVFDDFSAFHVGCAANGQGAEGMIDDFRIYGGALDAAAIRALYARVFPLAVTFAKPGPPYLRVGEKTELAWRIRLAGSAPFRGDVAWRLLGPDGQPLGPGETLHLDLAGDAKREVNLAFSPASPGEYIIEVSYPAAGGTQTERLACHVIPPEPEAPRPDEIQTELIERIDLTATLPPERFVEAGESRVVDSPLGRYRQAGSAQRSRFAVRATLPEADAAYVLEVDYPDDQPRTMEILGQPAATGSGYELQSGVYCGDEYPLSNRMLTQRCVFWARSTDMAFLFMTAEEGRPAAVAELRLYRVVGRLPNRLWTAPGGGRQIGIYYEDPALCYDFGGHESMPHFAKTIDRLMEYMEWSGQNLFMYPGVWYHGPLYPSRSQHLAMSRNHPPNFIGYLLARFEKRGLGFAPTLNVHNLSSLAHHQCTEDLLLSGNLPQSALMIYRDGMPNMGGWHGTPPNFNPLHPEVRQAILAMIDEMLELYGDSPAFRGICFHLPIHVMLWFGHADAGYNDYCIEAFERETGIAIPVAADDPSRVRLRAQWLEANAWEAWIAWRCRAIHGLYTEIAARLTARRPDLKLVLNTYRPTLSVCVKEPDYMQPGHVLRVNREAGFDPALYADDPAIVVQQTLYPSDYRWSRARPGRETNLDRQRLRHFQAESYAALAGQANVWINMHDRYWEDAVGRSKPLEADWLKEAPWRVSTLNPTPPQFLQDYLAPLRFGDVQTITKGGFLIGTLGVEDELARFSRAFRALPAVPFAEVAAPGDVRVRAANHAGALYFYAANTGNASATLRVRIDGQPAAVTELGEGATFAPAFAIPLHPYSLRPFRADGRNLSLKVDTE